MATLTSKLIVELLDRVTGPSRAVTSALARMNAAQARNNARLDAVRGRMIETGAVAYALARAVAAPARAATAFETKLEDIGQKIDAPISALPKLGLELKAVARDTTQTAAAIAEGMDVLAGMGASREDALGLLNPIGKAATAYNAEIADLSQAGYAALDNLKVPALEFGRALDAMAQAGKAGAFELKDMAQYFPTLGAGYQALGQTGVPAVADLAAALQIVRKGTGDSASAATNLSNILQKVNAPLTRKNFAKMGVNLEKEMKKAAKKGMTPIEAIADITNRTLKGDLGRLGDLFSDAQVQQGLRPLIQNLDLYRRIRAEALAAQGVVEADYQRRLQTGAIATQRWAIAFEGLSLAIGSALLPALTSLANGLVPIVNRISEWTERHPALTQAIVATTAALVALRVAAIAAQFSLLWMKGGAISAATLGLSGLSGAGKIASAALLPVAAGFRALRTAMIGYAASAAIAGNGAALSALGSSLLGLLNPLRLVTVAMRTLKLAVIGTGIGAVLVGIAMAGTWIYNNWTGIATAFEAFKGAFMRAIEPVLPAVQPVIDVFSWLFDVVSSLVGPVDELGGGWSRAGLAAGRFAGDVVVAIVQLPDRVAEVFREMITRLATFGTEMVAAGKALMMSLLEGIKAGAAEVLKYVAGIGSQIKKSISGAASGAWSSIKNAVGLGGESPAITGTRAAGGPVRAGGTYLVGERGPELVTFARNAFVNSATATARMARNAALASAVAAPVATGAGGSERAMQAPSVNMGGVSFVIHAAPGQSPQAIAQEVKRTLSAELRALSGGAYSDGAN
ncbi:phage tail tape measure protein [Kaistia granuli]|uniref:phage tail tape measure protein n=1 Tax=Kaistia granuli TaxID=363259 RepID=UPI00059477F7|nr:phage tail tape measure protein [Kaistia granuli]